MIEAARQSNTSECIIRVYQQAQNCLIKSTLLYITLRFLQFIF